MQLTDIKKQRAGCTSCTKGSRWTALQKDYKKHRLIYWIMVPVLLYYLVFCYIPMFGQVIAFQNYRPARGILGSDWVGLHNFIQFFKSPYAFRVIKNTIVLSLMELAIVFPAPILLALLLNELRSDLYRRLVQTISYMPHFISLVVTCGMVVSFVSSRGVITSLLVQMGMEPQNMLANNSYYRIIYVLSSVWKQIGWSSIIYLATLSGVDQNLYEAAAIDGAGRFQQMLRISCPSLIPIIAIQLIMRVGNLMSMGYEKTILLYNPVVYETADLISSYVYRVGLQDQSYSLGAAVGIFNAVINLALVAFANWFSRTYVKESLW